MKSFGRSFRVACGTLALLPSLAGADEPSAPAATRDDVARSVGRAVRFLETDMLAWRRDHGCAACHHGPMYLWSIGAASNAGYDIDRRLLRETTAWLLTDDEARVLPRRPNTPEPAPAPAPAPDATPRPVPGCCADAGGSRNRPRFVHPTLYLAHALRELPHDDPDAAAARRRILDHWTATQADDGLWVGRAAWPPIFSTPRVLASLAVSAVPCDDTLPDAPRRTIERATGRLRSSAPDESHQALVLQLLWRTRETRTDPLRDRVVSRLLAGLRDSQRADGGWSQTPERPSDAFATGQTIYALRQAGVAAHAPAIRRGLEFLVRTQQPDGSWPMTSRPNPETGRPADFLNPITYAATAWAVLGLSSSGPVPR